MFHPARAFEGLPVWQAELQRGDVVLFRFPVAEGSQAPLSPKRRPCLVLEVHDRLGRRAATLAYGTSSSGKANSGYNVVVSGQNSMEHAGLKQPTRFVGVRRITVSLDHSGFDLADITASPVIGRLDEALAERMNAVRARIQAEADIAREIRREKREEQRRWQQEGRGFLGRNRSLLAASNNMKGSFHD